MKKVFLWFNKSFAVFPIKKKNLILVQVIPFCISLFPITKRDKLFFFIKKKRINIGFCIELMEVMCRFDLGWKWLKVALHFQGFFFFLCVNSKITWFYCAVDKNTVHVLFIYCSRTVHGSHNTIHTFKNYFDTIFSVFNFSNNKFNPNRPIVCESYTCVIHVFWERHLIN